MKSIAFRKPSVVAVLATVILATALLMLAGSLTRPAEAVVVGQVRVQGFSAFDLMNVKGGTGNVPLREEGDRHGRRDREWGAGRS